MVGLQLSNISGCAKSRESFENYEKMERRHAHLTRIIWKAYVLIMCSGFGVAILLPIMYSIFRFPDPKYWRLPMEVQLSDRVHLSLRECKQKKGEARRSCLVFSLYFEHFSPNCLLLHRSMDSKKMSNFSIL